MKKKKKRKKKEESKENLSNQPFLKTNQTKRMNVKEKRYSP
jgi:hypothetical protein